MATKHGLKLEAGGNHHRGPGSSGLAVTFLLDSCSTTPDGRWWCRWKFPGAHYVGNRACMDCHAEIVREFPASPHARVHFEGAAMVGETGCESCHGPGSKHIETGGKQTVHHQPGHRPDVLFPMPRGCSGRIQPAAASSGHRRPHELRAMPRPARRGHPETERRDWPWPGRTKAARNAIAIRRARLFSSTKPSAKAARSATIRTARSTRRC